MTAWDPVVPHHWAVHRADALFSIVSGSTPKTTVPAYWGGDIVWVTPDDQQRGAVDKLFGGRRTITQQGLESCSTTLVPAGSVLLSSRAPIGYVSIAGQPLCTNQGFKTFVPKSDVDVEPRFVMWWLRLNRQRIEALGSGTTFPELSKRSTAAIPVPLPPLDEQRAVVETIERMLSRLDASRAGLALCQDRARLLRQSLLRRATSEGPIRHLAEVASTASGGTPKAGEASYYGGDIPWAVIGDLNDGIVSATEKTITPEGLRASSAKWVEAGALLVAMYGSIGKLGVAERRLTTNQAIAAVTPDQTVLDTRFLFYRLMADRAALIGAGKGGTQRNISQTILREWTVPVPPLDKQHEAVRYLDRALSVLEATEGLLAEVDAYCTALRRSILKAAFEGRLTPGSSTARSLDEALEEIA